MEKIKDGASQEYKDKVFELCDKIEEFLTGSQLDACLNALGICSGRVIREIVDDDNFEIEEEEELKKKVFNQIERAIKADRESGDCQCPKCLKKRNLESKTCDYVFECEDSDNRELLQSFFKGLSDQIVNLRLKNVKVIEIAIHLMAQISALAIRNSDTYETADQRMHQLISYTKSKFPAMWDKIKGFEAQENSGWE